MFFAMWLNEIKQPVRINWGKMEEFIIIVPVVLSNWDQLFFRINRGNFFNDYFTKGHRKDKEDEPFSRIAHAI